MVFLPFTKAIHGRTVTGIFFVHGNNEYGQHLSIKGSFAKRLQVEARKRIRFLWNHSSLHPPIVTLKSVREVGRDGLAESVPRFALPASGGVEEAGQYYEDAPLADWVFQGLQSSATDDDQIFRYAGEQTGFSDNEHTGMLKRVRPEEGFEVDFSSVQLTFSTRADK